MESVICGIRTKRHLYWHFCVRTSYLNTNAYCLLHKSLTWKYLCELYMTHNPTFYSIFREWHKLQTWKPKQQCVVSGGEGGETVGPPLSQIDYVFFFVFSFFFKFLNLLFFKPTYSVVIPEFRVGPCFCSLSFFCLWYKSFRAIFLLQNIQFQKSFHCFVSDLWRTLLAS